MQEQIRVRLTDQNSTDVQGCASVEQRSLSQMANVLIREAILARRKVLVRDINRQIAKKGGK